MAKPRFFELCLAEPFRIFFPLATLLGISGVSLWPLYFSGIHQFYPGPMHSRVMIEGFLAGFVFGFLGTALPRLLSAPPLRRAELWSLLLLYLLSAGLHIGHQSRAGDLAFIALLGIFGVGMVSRFHRREDLPPPSFVLVSFGLLSGFFGPVLTLCGGQGWVSGRVVFFGALLLNQAFVLFLLLGIGAFLLPRFLGLHSVSPPLEGRAASPEWWRRAAISGVTAMALLGSYWLEAGEPFGSGAAWLRSLTALIYLVASMAPFRRQACARSTVSVAVQMALLALVAGLIFPLLWPAQRLAGLHLIFLGGYSLMTFTVATRVVLGHSGHEALFATRLPALQMATVLLLLGAVLRAVGDFSAARPSWLNAASYLWMLAAAVWGFAVLPKVRLADPENEPAHPEPAPKTPA